MRPGAAVFDSIVVGVDGREGGREALRLARRLAGAGGGELIAVRVFQYAHRPAYAGSPAVEEESRATLGALERELSRAGMTGVRAEVAGDVSPARALHRVAERERADLIVVGSTHRGPLGRVLVGAVSLGTLHGSPCPVAVARTGDADDRRPRSRIGLVGVGFDGGEESRQALALGAALARRAGARLEVRYVVGIPPAPYAAEAFETDRERGFRAEAQQMVDRALAELDVDAVGEAVLGVAVEGLVELTERVDLLVVGSRGWGPVRRILLGSTAASLLQHAACPVLVLPRGASTGQPGEHDPEPPSAAGP
jgi:nucleotide-binding universal stress UspA family protein